MDKGENWTTVKFLHTDTAHRLLRNGKQFKELDITDGAEADHHAVLTKVDQGLLLAWVRETGGKTAVMYQYQDLNALTK